MVNRWWGVLCVCIRNTQQSTLIHHTCDTLHMQYITRAVHHTCTSPYMSHPRTHPPPTHPPTMSRTGMMSAHAITHSHGLMSCAAGLITSCCNASTRRGMMLLDNNISQSLGSNTCVYVWGGRGVEGGEEVCEGVVEGRLDRKISQSETQHSQTTSRSNTTSSSTTMDTIDTPYPMPWL